MNLSHHRIILSASYPNQERDRRYLQVPDSSRRVAEAIIPLVSLLIRNGASIVYGGQPDITRLLASVVSNFPGPVHKFAEAPASIAREPESKFGKVILYQSAAFTAIPEVDWLRASPHVSISNVPVDPDEAKLERDRSPLQYPKSLQNLRHHILMDARPTALVCVGGMEGVETETKQFVEKFTRTPIFIYASTGGASQLLAKQLPAQRTIIVDSASTAEKAPADLIDDWKFSNQELSELGPYTTAAFHICGVLADRG